MSTSPAPRLPLALVIRRKSSELAQIGSILAMVTIMLGVPFLEDGPLVRWLLLFGCGAAVVYAITATALLVGEHLAGRRRRAALVYWEANRIRRPAVKSGRRSWSVEDAS